jgi:hypothetical protein
MPIYVTLLRFTEKGIQHVKDTVKPIFYSLSGLASGKSLISFVRSWPFGQSVVPRQ